MTTPDDAHRDVAQLVEILTADAWRLSVLRLLRDAFPDAWVTGGFVRNAVWDYTASVHTPVRDVDVVYLNDKQVSKKSDLEIEQHLAARAPGVPWCVRNQSRMASRGGDRRYQNLSDALVHFPDVSSAVAVRLGRDERMDVLAPYGLFDLFRGVVAPTPIAYAKDPLRYVRRLDCKRDTWRKAWPSLAMHSLQ